MIVVAKQAVVVDPTSGCEVVPRGGDQHGLAHAPGGSTHECCWRSPPEWGTTSLSSGRRLGDSWCGRYGQPRNAIDGARESVGATRFAHHHDCSGRNCSRDGTPQNQCKDRVYNTDKGWYKSFFYGAFDAARIKSVIGTCVNNAYNKGTWKWVGNDFKVQCKLPLGAYGPRWIGRTHSAPGPETNQFACGDKQGERTNCLEAYFKKTGGNRVRLKTIYPIKCTGVLAE